MLSLDQMRRELEAIEKFNGISLRDGAGVKVQLIGDVVRIERKRELLALIKSIAERN